jgi:hypothetical protein
VALTTLGFNIKFIADNLSTPEWYFSAVTAFFFLSLGVNTLVTALIVYRIIIVYNDIRGFNISSIRAHGGNGRHDLNPLISILIESGLITFIGQLTQSVMYKSATVQFPLVGGCVVMLYVSASIVDLVSFFHLVLFITQGISTTIVLVRVEMGISYDRNTSRTVNSSNSGRPIQLTPFTSKLNQTTIIDVVGDDPHDAYSERKIPVRPK